MTEQNLKSNFLLSIEHKNSKSLSKEDLNNLTPEAVSGQNVSVIICSCANIRDISNITKLNGLEGLVANGNIITDIPKNINYLVNLTFLNLSRNLITNVENNVFALLNLTVLDLSHNYIRTVPEMICKLKNLQFLNLCGNQIETLPESISSLAQLKFLDCSCNELEFLPDNLGNLNSLTSLMASNNKLSTLPISIKSLKSLEILQVSNNCLYDPCQSIYELSGLLELNVSHNRLEHIPDAIERLQKLIVLNVSFNCLTELPFSVGKLSQLKYLNIRANPQLSALPGSILLTSFLSELLIDQCHFDHISDDVGYCTNLRILSINGNFITQLPIDLKNCQCLAVLKWSNNRLDCLPDFLGSLVRLQILDLSHNNLDQLPSSLQFLPSLRKINLSHNQFSTFPEILTKISTLDSIEFESNAIEYLPPSLELMTQLQAFHFKCNKLKDFPRLPYSIVDLDLSGNPLMTFNEDLVALKELKSLDISHTAFDGIPDICYRSISLVRFAYDQKHGRKIEVIDDRLGQLVNLKYIDLSNNDLTEIPSVFLSMANLTNIKLNGNRIKTIESNFIHQFKEKLESLDLSNNLIHVLPSKAFGEFRHLTDLSLQGNPCRYPPPDVFNSGEMTPICSYLKAFSSMDGAILDQIVNIIVEKFPKERTRHFFRKLKIPEAVITELEATYRGKFNQKLLLMKGIEAWREYLEDKATTDSLLRCFFLINEKSLNSELIRMKTLVNRIKL